MQTAKSTGIAAKCSYNHNSQSCVNSSLKLLDFLCAEIMGGKTTYFFGCTADSSQPCQINYTGLQTKNGLGFEGIPSNNMQKLLPLIVRGSYIL